MKKQLTKRELFVAAWALSYAQHNVSEINEGHSDPLAEGEDVGLLNLSVEDYNVYGIVPDEKEVEQLAAKIVEIASKSK